MMFRELEYVENGVIKVGNCTRFRLEYAVGGITLLVLLREFYLNKSSFCSFFVKIDLIF